jgi:hypothetical protein
LAKVANAFRLTGVRFSLAASAATAISRSVLLLSSEYCMLDGDYKLCDFTTVGINFVIK